MATEINSYELSRNWFDWCFENPDKIKPNHTALYFFIIEHCNRLGWKEKFGLPMEMTKDAIGISNYRTYTNTFNDLVSWGFLKVYQKSVNQYSANVIGLVKNTKANTKALSKATQKHSQKQVHGIVGIDKPINLLTLEPINTSETILKENEIEILGEPLKAEEKIEINFIVKIGHDTFYKKISEVLEDEYLSVLESHLLGSLKAIDKNILLSRMNDEYPNYEFKDRNHLSNSVKSVGNKIILEKTFNKTTNNGTERLNALRDW